LEFEYPEGWFINPTSGPVIAKGEYIPDQVWSLTNYDVLFAPSIELGPYIHEKVVKLVFGVARAEDFISTEEFLDCEPDYISPFTYGKVTECKAVIINGQEYMKRVLITESSEGVVLGDKEIKVATVKNSMRYQVSAIAPKGSRQQEAVNQIEKIISTLKIKD